MEGVAIQSLISWLDKKEKKKDEAWNLVYLCWLADFFRRAEAVI